MDDIKKKTGEAKPDERLSRREWLLSLGGAIVLAGTAGQSGEAGVTAKRAESVVAGEPATTLPPGLYTASVDHLTHVLVRDEPYITIPAAAETEYVGPRRGAFQPQFLSTSGFESIRRLVEIILGEDLKTSERELAPTAPATIYDEVTEWIDLAARSAAAVRKVAMDLSSEQRALAVAYFGSEEPVRELETFEPDRILLEGLAWLATTSANVYGRDFMRLTRAEQLHLVSSISDGLTRKTEANAGVRLFGLVKRESIRGFYTSRMGLDELDVRANAFHPESPGCTLKSSF